MKAIMNGRVILPDHQGNFQVQQNMAVLFTESIAAIVPQNELAASGADAVVDAAGCYVAPGFINVHVHGCNGADTMDEDADALRRIREGQAAMGVTGFLPTTMTYDIPRIQQAFERIRREMGRKGGAQVLGCHMEGPFISASHKGAQAADDICRADFSVIEPFKDVVKIVTVAPEELPAGSFVADCHRHGIIVSMGHTSADYDTAMRAIEELGIRHVTHLFNAMTGFHHRRPGVVGAALDTAVNCELIADNVHSHPAAQRLVYHAKGGRNIILITDSMRACGLGDGASELGGQKVFVKGTLATLEDGTIAGSVLTMNRAVANFAANTGAPLAAVVALASQLPAQELGLYHERGSIETGKRADLVLFDDALNVGAVWSGGESIYRNSDFIA